MSSKRKGTEEGKREKHDKERVHVRILGGRFGACMSD